MLAARSAQSRAELILARHHAVAKRSLPEDRYTGMSEVVTALVRLRSAHILIVSITNKAPEGQIISRSISRENTSRYPSAKLKSYTSLYEHHDFFMAPDP